MAFQMGWKKGFGETECACYSARFPGLSPGELYWRARSGRMQQEQEKAAKCRFSFATTMSTRR
jgi:hypothetical protein